MKQLWNKLKNNLAFKIVIIILFVLVSIVFILCGDLHKPGVLWAKLKKVLSHADILTTLF